MPEPATSDPDRRAPHEIELQRRGLLFVLSSPSGAGKSTVAQLVARLYDAGSGAGVAFACR